MGKITRRRHTWEFKISIIRELESGKNLAQLSRENNLHLIMISRWRLKYRKNSESTFSGNGNTYKEAARNQELERLVGKLYAENEFLKKSVRYLGKESTGREREIKSGEKFMIVLDCLDSISVNRGTELFGASRSGFYK